MDIKDILLHTRKLQSALKEFSTDELNTTSEKLNKIINKRKIKAKKEKFKKEIKLKKIKEIQQQLKENGLSLTDLSIAKIKKIKKQRPPKYLFNDEAGEKITWTGQGRMPNILKNHIKHGKKIEDFLIN